MAETLLWYKRHIRLLARRPRLREQYRRLKKRRGSKRAAVAVGHSILVIYYHMMKTGEPFRERGMESLEAMDKARLQRHLVQRLESLGCQVTIQSPPAA